TRTCTCTTEREICWQDSIALRSVVSRPHVAVKGKSNAFVWKGVHTNIRWLPDVRVSLKSGPPERDKSKTKLQLIASKTFHKNFIIIFLKSLFLFKKKNYMKTISLFLNQKILI